MSAAPRRVVVGYDGSARARKASLGEVVEDSLTSLLGLGLQLVMLAALIALVRVDWARFLLHHPQRGGDVHPPQSPHGE
jgi:hypothetical protein